jgi:hypothetical protein
LRSAPPAPGKTGKIIDRQGYGGVEFISTTARHRDERRLHGDGARGRRDRHDDVGGRCGPPGHRAARRRGRHGVARFGRLSKNVSKRIGYKGTKRYVQVNVKSTTTATTPIAVTAVLFNPNVAPVSNP